MKVTLTLIPALLGSAACTMTQSSVTDTDAQRASSREQFEAIKSLAGEWDGTASTGDATFPTHVSYRLTGGGTAVVETQFPKDEHEMVTVYHLDGPRLLLTHYCSAGNQPRMLAVHTSHVDDPVKTIAWDLESVTNLASPGALHMHSVKHVIEGKDKLHETWTSWQDGKPSHAAEFDLHRVDSSVMVR